MAIDRVGQVAGAQPSQGLETGKEKFGKVLDGVGKPEGAAGQRSPSQPPGAQGPSEVAPRQVTDTARPGAVVKAPQVSQVKASQRVEAKAQVTRPEGAQALDRVASAQRRLDHILQLAQSGKSFTPAELLAMQAQIYRATQELDLAGKVVEKATSGVKQVLQTQV